MYETEELKAKIVISGVLVFKDKDGEIVKEVPFQSVQESAEKSYAVAVAVLPPPPAEPYVSNNDWGGEDDDQAYVL